MWQGCVVIVALMCAGAEGVVSNVVHIAQGPVRGLHDSDYGVYIFYNIPYATAPKGRDKFKAPLPPPVWNETRDAETDPNIKCPQGNSFSTPDCLIANIYAPDTNDTSLPVVVLIHGGSYIVGSGHWMRPKHLIKRRKIVYVNFNYRLGAYGYLCLGTPGAPGNAGMKDQLALLRWVNKNIARFGGNPNDVTLEGSSAGSTSIDLLLLSKPARGLFHKAIPESGANLAAWAVQIDPIASAKEFASNVLNFTNADDLDALEEYYKTIPFSLLATNFLGTRTKYDFIFAPCIEVEIAGVERVLDDAPVNILKSGNYSKVPMLYGFANLEGSFRLDTNYEVFKNRMNKKFSDLLPTDLQFANDEDKERVANRVREFYFGNKVIGEETILGFIDYFSDAYIDYPILRSATMQVEAGNHNVYLYQYSFSDKDKVLPPGSVPPTTPGAGHISQAIAVFYEGGSDREKKMKSILWEMWLNFITTGAPVPPGTSLPAWPPANASRSPYMELTLPPELRGVLLPERAQLWDEIYAKHYRAPSPPLSEETPFLESLLETLETWFCSDSATTDTLPCLYWLFYYFS